MTLDQLIKETPRSPVTVEECNAFIPKCLSAFVETRGDQESYEAVCGLLGSTILDCLKNGGAIGIGLARNS